MDVRWSKGCDIPTTKSSHVQSLTNCKEVCQQVNIERKIVVAVARYHMNCHVHVILVFNNLYHICVVTTRQIVYVMCA